MNINEFVAALHGAGFRRMRMPTESPLRLAKDKTEVFVLPTSINVWISFGVMEAKCIPFRITPDLSTTFSIILALEDSGENIESYFQAILAHNQEDE